MKTQILMNASIHTVTKVTGWMLGILVGGLTIRLIMDLYSAYEENDCTLVEVLKKMKKRIFAVVIALTASSLVVYFQKYYY